MSLEIWLAFVAASAVLLVIPGPTILLVVSYALGRGWRVAAPVGDRGGARRPDRDDAVDARGRRAARELGGALHRC